MLSKRSIRTQFLIQLIVASAALLLIFSSFLYLYIQESIYDEKRTELLKVAKNVNDYESLFSSEASNSDTLLEVSVEMVTANEVAKHEQFYESTINGYTYLVLIHPFEKENGHFLKISRDITTT
ncbi:MAG: sensor histidine kinase, partial [Sulfurimonadaceae bacterium]|nr:sensor histidine kinase [Sulfurimonadaceae bacterium]